MLVLMVVPAACHGSSPRHPAGRTEPARQWQHEWLDGAVFYEIFVRSFADSDGDGIGDLNGLIARLDYLNDGDPTTDTDLGVTGIWLMPVFDSPSYHGYDVVDYRQVEPDYGTRADLERLLDEAGQRGVRVIVDLVINHTSSQHPWFVEAAASPASPTRSWYLWSLSDRGWTQPWGGSYGTWHRNPADGMFYYGVFWGGMPDLNLANPEVEREVVDIAGWWLDRGVAGFRLDAVRYLIETGPGPGQADTAPTHAFWRRFSTRIRALEPEALLVGESWADTATIASYYGSTEQVKGGDELPLTFDFPLAEAMIETARLGEASRLATALTQIDRRYPDGARDAPFLTNHDQVRLATQLGGSVERLRVSASLLLTMPGVPFLYYGEEVGLANGGTSSDESKRTPMPWDASSGVGFTTGVPWFEPAPGRETANVEAQTDDPGSLLSHYRGLIRARSASQALASGRLVLDHDLAADTPIVWYLRQRDEQRALVVINLGSRPMTAGPLPVEGSPAELLYSDGTSAAPAGAPGSWTLLMPPYSTAIWRFDAP